ncbi:tumor necrosis factor receptor superfamily member 8 isoform X1 [Cricetulus griseus]|uniref:tumor necrosis factor receptor superfamily member 8 isoform X1 n=1 Tax=Cricetulus griseus TaxID=10029 RepID=UPI0015C3D178|nr:tumor necrosis factor receptor superfamily member 8 isoform X1 [Cricetulus griseus]
MTEGQLRFEVTEPRTSLLLFPGLSPTQPCPQGPDHCRKQCDPDHYVNEDGHCTACVTCLEGLVEKAPCSMNSSRVCECQPGTYCKTPGVNSCARCSLHSRCSGGEVVKVPGTAEKDTVCELPSSGPGPDCSNPDDCKTLTSHATPQATPTLKTSATDSMRSLTTTGSTGLVQEDATELLKVPEFPSSQAREPSPDPDKAEMNMNLKLPSPGTLPDFSTSGNSEEPASTASTLSLLVDVQTSSRMQPTSPLSTGTPFLDPGPMLFWVAMVILLLGSSTFFLCYWKACRRRIQQSKCACVLGSPREVAALCWPCLGPALPVPNLLLTPLKLHSWYLCRAPPGKPSPDLPAEDGAGG